MWGEVCDQLKHDWGERDSYLLIWDCVSMLLGCGLIQELMTDVAGCGTSPSSFIPLIAIRC